MFIICTLCSCAVRKSQISEKKKNKTKRKNSKHLKTGFVLSNFQQNEDFNDSRMSMT